MNEYSRISDEIYSLSTNTRLLFNTSVTWFDENNKPRSHYNEYKTNNRPEGSVVIKRKLNYFLTLEYTIKGGEKVSVMMYPEHVYCFLENLNYIRNNWFTNIMNTYGIINDSLVVLDSTQQINIKFPMDKIIRIEPTVKKDENGDTMAVTIYVNSINNPVILTKGKINGMIHVLTTLDMATYANTALSMVTLRSGGANRTDFSSNSVSNEPINTVSSSGSKNGRDFKYKQSIL